MKLLDKGKYWFWEEAEEKIEFDKKILNLQREYNVAGKSIWGTDKCERCGACCYKFQIKSLKEKKEEQYNLCPYQRIKEESECKINKKKPRECNNYGCWKREYKMGTPAERYAMIRIAIDILKTKQERNLTSLIKE